MEAIFKDILQNLYCAFLFPFLSFNIHCNALASYFPKFVMAAYECSSSIKIKLFS